MAKRGKAQAAKEDPRRSVNATMERLGGSSRSDLERDDMRKSGSPLGYRSIPFPRSTQRFKLALPLAPLQVKEASALSFTTAQNKADAACTLPRKV